MILIFIWNQSTTKHGSKPHDFKNKMAFCSKTSLFIKDFSLSAEINLLSIKSLIVMKVGIQKLYKKFNIWNFDLSFTLMQSLGRMLWYKLTQIDRWHNALDDWMHYRVRECNCHSLATVVLQQEGDNYIPAPCSNCNNRKKCVFF